MQAKSEVHFCLVRALTAPKRLGVSIGIVSKKGESPPKLASTEPRSVVALTFENRIYC
jgi:hypothetical protein